MTKQALTSELQRILSEPASAVADRARSALDGLLEDARGKVVLFGAGGLGRQTMDCLRTLGIEPLAVTDNNSKLWGTRLDGVDILAPADAASRYGSDALFIVAIWNPFHWYQETRKRLTELGCRRITPPSPVYWRFPGTFLPFYTQDVPENVHRQADEVLKAAQLWSDDRSREQYFEQVMWRARGDWTFSRPEPEDKDSYFLPRVFSLVPDEVFVDCGAFDGDTLRVFLPQSRGEFRQFVGLEPDPASFAKLEEYVAGLPAAVRSRVRSVHAAVGAERTTLSFAATGGLGSKPSSDGTFAVSCLPISEVVDASTRVTFIKMDIEGAELDALRGARPVIERDRPVLSICVYHLQHDLWSLPLLMKEMVPEYRMFLRAHEGDGWQTVAYAVPPERCVPGLLP